MTNAQVMTAPKPALPPPPPEPRGWTVARIAGYGFLGFWLAGGVGLVFLLYDGFEPEFYARYAPKFLGGLLVTLEIVFLSVLIGSVLSLPAAAGRMSKNPLAAVPAFAFVYFFRGTPLIAQTFLVYYGAGIFRDSLEAANLWWFFRDPFYCVLFTFSLNTAAYQAEILRGAIGNVDKGQWEAGKAMGLSKFAIYRNIILPQAMIVALRPYGNEIVLMIKGSAIASIVTVFDLMGETRRAFSRTFDFETYIWAAIFYLILVELLRRLWARLEIRLTRHLVRIAPSTAKNRPAIDSEAAAIDKPVVTT
ncbi:MAG: ABC transporter permease [Alphaproteobacteria bacterium]|nr:MAG: ABC transporter permease [Alphaproteobacteria bacterium]